MAKQIGIIIVGHGSRAQANNDHFFKLCETMQAHSQFPVVGALLDFSEQTIQHATQQHVATGCTHIVIIPFLLYGGIHLTKHIPERIMEVINPEVITFEVASSLGEHPLIIEALSQKIAIIKE